MIGLSKLSINRPVVKRLEVVVTIIWLIYFMDIEIPPLSASLFNALSYPVTVILVVLHWNRIAYVATRNIPLLIFLGTAMLSFVWSTDISRTFDGSRGLLRTFLFGAYFTTNYNLKEQMRILAWVLGLIAIASVVLCLVFPQYAYEEAGWGGVFPYKNLLGRAMVLGAILFLIIALNDLKRNWLAVLGIGVAVFLVLFSNSSTSLLLLFVMLPQIFLYWIIQQQYRLRLVFLSFICILIFGMAILIMVNQETILVDILGEGLTFNGRTPIWTLIIEKVLHERPILGYGYQAFWSSDTGAYVILHTWASNDAPAIPTTFNAHNAYLEIFSNLGFLGLFLYGFVLVNAVPKIVILLFFTKKVEFFWLFQFLLLVCLASLADVGIGLGNTSTYGILSIAAFLSISVEYERFKKLKKNMTLDNFPTK